MKIAYLFPDTNLFIQCQSLDQIDWSNWQDFDEIHICVSRPVQLEIDKHKSQGKGRPQKRGRSTAALFRTILESQEDFLVVCDHTPQVKLFLATTLQPSPNIGLDYSHNDDRLVGIAHAYAKANPNAYVQLITHDIGPLISAKAAGVSYYSIPDSWLLPTEDAEADKKTKDLENQVRNLKKAEPEFEVHCLLNDTQIEKIELECVRYEALSQTEISELLGRLKKQFPISTEFGSSKPTERLSLGILSKEIFTPATEAEINNYRDEQYPSWLSKCEEVLNRYHTILQQKLGPPACVFSIKNIGTRPADDALVTLEAKGAITIMPYEEPKADTLEQESFSPLPIAPQPPSGQWKTVSILGALQHPLFGTEFWEPRHPSYDLMSALHSPTPRDPNKFYYKPNRPALPTTTYSLECKQWRHAIEAECFDVDIYFPFDTDKISGALECRIHAANLSSRETYNVPVRIKITGESAYEHALKAIKRLSMQELLKQRVRLK